MVRNRVVPEIEVLVATVQWLQERKILPYQFSVAQGKGIDLGASQKQVIEALRAAGMPKSFLESVQFVREGPDLVGASGSEYWQIEAKGAGTGGKPTQRTNFDRALASIVSYYTDTVPTETPDARPCLGLALPATPIYTSELRRRVQKPLRRQLNLWVLLYEPESREIRAFSPDEGYPPTE